MGATCAANRSPAPRPEPLEAAIGTDHMGGAGTRPRKQTRAVDPVVARSTELGTRMNGHPEHAHDCVAELSEMLTDVTDPAVTAHIVESLGHGWTDAACRAVLPLAGHATAVVRLAVTQALHLPDDPNLAQQTLDAMVRLSADVSDDVRDWATFTLGSQFDVDSRDVRAALADRLDDPSEAVRAEALVGLARRHDDRALDAARAGLSNDQTGALTFEAARLLADPVLHPLLVKWSTDRPDDEGIALAVAACDPVQQRSRQRQEDALLRAVQRLFDLQSPELLATMFCDRFDNEVQLSSGDVTRVWHVTELLRHAGGDVPTAAQMVVDDHAKGSIEA